MNFLKWRHIDQGSIARAVRWTVVAAKTNRVRKVPAKSKPCPASGPVNTFIDVFLGLLFGSARIYPELDFDTIEESHPHRYPLLWGPICMIDFRSVRHTVTISVLVQRIRLVGVDFITVL